MAGSKPILATNQEKSDSDRSPFAPPQISLPKGGGAIRGIGEKFSTNSLTGTGSLSIAVPLSPARSGFTPQISLSYDSGSGNGPFGIGWSLSCPSITRKTDKGLPQYDDSVESDVFILSGAEDLVPELRLCEKGWEPVEAERDGYRIRNYRPRVEGLFARIERWTRVCDGDVHWRSLSKDNILTFYGRDPQSRICDPENPSHVFSWLICESFDAVGNAVLYEHAPEGDRGVDLALANERNRHRSANRYLRRICYGNRRPILLDPELPSFRKSHASPGELEAANWMFEAVFDFGGDGYREHPPDERGRIFVEVGPAHGDALGPIRTDPFSSYRSGFEVRTYRLCRRVLMFHSFPHELGTDRYLVRSLELGYEEKRIGSFLRNAVQSGFKRQPDRRYLKSSLPALDLEYSVSPLENSSAPGRAISTKPASSAPRSNARWRNQAPSRTASPDGWFAPPAACLERKRTVG